jgi:general secretion pathway protein A
MLAQDNLPNKLERKEAFRSRIAVVGHLDPLSFEDMCGMISHRITTAGGGSLKDYFDEGALHEVYAVTKGIPRDICVLCDACLVNGYVTNQPIADAALVEHSTNEMAREKRWPVEIKKEANGTKKDTTDKKDTAEIKGGNEAKKATPKSVNTKGKEKA